MVIVDFYNLLEIGFLDLVWSRGDKEALNPQADVYFLGLGFGVVI